MPSIGAGCHELRVQDANVAWRIVYFVSSEAVVILEIFAKTTRTTPMAIIRESARRLKAFRSIGSNRSTMRGERRMQHSRRKALTAAGWRVGSARQFLELSDAEAALVELKLALSDTLRRSRIASGLSQVELANRMGSSQSRVAKLEAGDPSVSLDLLVRALLAAGATRRALAKAIQQG
jgi:DNA-binding XRE family transcriptional regulator